MSSYWCTRPQQVDSMYDWESGFLRDLQVLLSENTLLGYASQNALLSLILRLEPWMFLCFFIAQQLCLGVPWGLESTLSKALKGGYLTVARIGYLILSACWQWERFSRIKVFWGYSWNQESHLAIGTSDVFCPDLLPVFLKLAFKHWDDVMCPVLTGVSCW